MKTATDIVLERTAEEAALIQEIVGDVLVELGKARQNYEDFHSAHEGYATLLEEVHELWDAVRLKQGLPGRLVQMQAEATQVAAMAIRFIMDVKDD